MSLRSVKMLYPALRDDIADLRTRRPLPGPTLERMGAFLFLNHHGPQIYPPDNRGLTARGSGVFSPSTVNGSCYSRLSLEELA